MATTLNTGRIWSGWEGLRLWRRHARRGVVVLCAVMLGACATSEFDADTTSAALRADADGNRNVSCEEWRTWIGATYSANDTDGDGSLTEAEYETFVVETGLFQSIPLTKIDTNADQRYSSDEVTAAGTVVFEQGDRNNDCVLSRRELNVPRPKAEAEEQQEPEAGPRQPREGSCVPPLCRQPVE